MKIFLSIVIFLLIYFSNAFAKDKSPLIKAVESQNIEEVKRLVQSGANINERDELGFSPLLMAVGLNSKSIVLYLVSKGADTHVKANSGFGVLHRAAMNKNPEILKYVINFGLDVNDHGSEYCSPLDFALRYNALQDHGAVDNARLLLERGAKQSINFLCNGYTPLMVSIPNSDVIHILLESGADVNIINRTGKNAFMLAKESGANQSVLKLLIPSKQSKNKPKSLEQLTQEDGSLMWERKTPKNGDIEYTALKANQYCKNLNWSGFSDYRIPTVKEFQKITLKEPITNYVINGIDEYYIDPKKFPNITPVNFWVQLENGELGYYSFTARRIQTICPSCEESYVMCVRGK
jgi:ankyrin repeat protein